jgi:hypothetical protein
MFWFISQRRLTTRQGLRVLTTPRQRRSIQILRIFETIA